MRTFPNFIRFREKEKKNATVFNKTLFIFLLKREATTNVCLSEEMHTGPPRYLTKQVHRDTPPSAYTPTRKGMRAWEAGTEKSLGRHSSVRWKNDCSSWESQGKWKSFMLSQRWAKKTLRLKIKAAIHPTLEHLYLKLSYDMMVN